MDFFKPDIAGLAVIVPQVFEDERGYFFESYQAEKWREACGGAVFVQDNESFSKHGTLRGLHFQKPPYAQAKLVRVLDGVVWDVAVDLRRTSPTFGRWFGVELSAANKKQLFIPRGFAHGFSVLSPSARFAYKCDQLYHPEAEGAIYFADAELNIDWKLRPEEAVLSEKDAQNPPFARYQEHPCF